MSAFIQCADVQGNGYKTFLCDCGYTYTEILASSGHTFGAWKTFLPTEAGLAGIDVRFCTVCGAYELRESESVGTGTNPTDPNHEHAFVLVESRKADCENMGFARYYCACGAGKVEFTDALGHDWVLGECVLETCTTDGYTPWICNRCGDEKPTDLVPALGHIDENNDNKCDRCGEPMGTAQEEAPQTFGERISAFFRNFFDSIRNFFANLFG